MPKYCFTKNIPYSMVALFDIIKDVDQYQEFLPGVESSRTYDHGNSCFTGRLTVGYKMIKQTYQSHVMFGITDESAYVCSQAIDGPFDYLVSRWDLVCLNPDETEITLSLEFEMKQFILKQLLAPYLDRGATEFVLAFERRAHLLLAG